MGPRDVIQEIVRIHVPGAVFDDAMSLGADGLGLDSIAIAEVLLECEVRFAVPFHELLEEREPLTVERLIRHLEAFAAR